MNNEQLANSLQICGCSISCNRQINMGLKASVHVTLRGPKMSPQMKDYLKKQEQHDLRKFGNTR